VTVTQFCAAPTLAVGSSAVFRPSLWFMDEHSCLVEHDVHSAPSGYPIRGSSQVSQSPDDAGCILGWDHHPHFWETVIRRLLADNDVASIVEKYRYRHALPQDD
jgi:hypothetical protein